MEEYKTVVLNPKHGYGAHLNPCLDCKVFMVKKAKNWMEQHGFDFIVTGEVVGQRPMSQRKETMPIVAKESGADDRLLRPLCAEHLPKTLPEREGWVDRSKLPGFSGRGRKPQIELAHSFGFKEYSQPAGGCCFLTNEHYTTKLLDLWNHKGKRDYELDDIMLLKVGRHLRPRPHFKMIIGREEGENNFLQGYRDRFTHCYPLSHKGPFALVAGEISEEDVALAAGVTARYSDAKAEERVEVHVAHLDGRSASSVVKPLLPEDILPSWYV